MFKVFRRDAHRQQQQTNPQRSTAKFFGALKLIAPVVALGVLYAAFSGADKSTAETTAQPSVADVLKSAKIGQMRPFELHSEPRTEITELAFFGSKGEIRDFREFEGKIVLVNFWALWCAPCLREMPSIDRLAAWVKETHGKDLVVVAASIDRDDPAKPLAFLKQFNLTNVVFFHDPTAMAHLKVRANSMPFTLLLDRKGREIARFNGPAEWDAAEAKLFLEKAATLP